MLKVMRDQFRNLKWILWFVVIVFVLLIFVDWGMGRNRGGGIKMAGVAAKVGSATISEGEFLKELRNTEERYRTMYGQQFEKLRAQLDLPNITMQTLVDRQLLLGEAAQMGLSVSDDELLDKIRSFPAFHREDGSFVGEQLYARILRSNQMTPEEFEPALRRDLLVSKLQDALQAGIVITDEELEREYRRRNETVSGELVFVGVDKGLDRAVVTDAEAKAFWDAHQDRFAHSEQRQLRYLLVDSARLRRTIAVAEPQIADYYATHGSEFQKGEQVHARHILIRPGSDDDAGWHDAQNRVRDVAAKARAAGADFAALAKQYSEDTGSKESGGDLGFFARGRMVKEFEDAVFALKPGEVSGPVKSQFGFHIIKLEERQPGGPKPLGEVRDQIKDKLAEGLADAEGSRRATALREKIDAAKLATEEQWRALADDVVTSNVTPFVGKGDPIPGLGRDPELLAEIADAKEGTVGGPRRSSRGWIVYRVAQVRAAGVTPFEEAKDEAKEAAKRSKAIEVLRADLEARRAALAAAPLEGQAGALRGSFQKLTDQHRGASIPGVGTSAALEDALFAAPVSTITPAVAIGERGVAIARVTAKKMMERDAFAKDKSSLRDNLVQDELQKLLSSMLAEAKRENPVNVNQELLDRFKRRQG